VVAIIGLLAAIAIPNFLRARSTSQQNACINNLRQIDAAIQQWALQSGANESTPVTSSGIQPYLGRGSGGTLPWCPLDSSHKFANSYTISTPSVVPLCQQQPSGDASGNYVHALPSGG